jgi:GNAT superfamily N-acetyltransferase
MLTLRFPEPDEADALTDLCLRSKAAWGYDADFMEACRQELAVRPEDVASLGIQVADDDGVLVGIVQIAMRGEVAGLAKLFVEPSRLRAGVGRRLFEWATATARRNGACVLEIEADPSAAEFYRRMGATDDGTAPSGSIPGRLLPRLKLPL